MATLEEILKSDSMSQVSEPKKSKTVPPRFSIVIPPIARISLTGNRLVVAPSRL